MTLDSLRWLGPLVLAVLASWFLDRSIAKRGLTPPGFVAPPEDPGALGPSFRRALAMAAIAFVFFIGIFAPLGLLGLEPATEIEIRVPQLFQLHILFVFALGIWYVLGFGPRSAGDAASRPGLADAWRSQFGLRKGGVLRELALGAGLGLAAWVAVLVVLVLVGSLVYLVGGEEALPESPPAAVVWIAALPLGVRFAVSLSAGVVEELFFRGFLQPRVGIGLSTGAFVLAHLSYEQPMMLVGITLLSIIFAAMVQWRQSIWAAIAAHAVFDGVQLLFVIPQLLDLLEPAASGLPPVS